VTDDALGAASFDIAADNPPGGTTLTVVGEIDVATSPALRRELHSLIDDGATAIVIDFSATTFIDSSGLGVLVGALKRLPADGHDGALVLKGLQDPVRKVFEITGLTELFVIED